MEDAIVKTVAGFLNSDGGTLLIGIDPEGNVYGLDADYELVKPKNADGFVNWLTTHLINAIGHAAAMHARARIKDHEDKQICRVDVAQSSVPIWSKTSKEDRVFYVRMNNSTRAMPEDEITKYTFERWKP
jgi:type I restriction enzyme, R subunit